MPKLALRQVGGSLRASVLPRTGHSQCRPWVRIAGPAAFRLNGPEADLPNVGSESHPPLSRA
jgi:hypothetical protein